MADEILRELWNAKDNIAKEHGYSVDALAEYFLKKQAVRHGRLRLYVGEQEAEQGVLPTVPPR